MNTETLKPCPYCGGEASHGTGTDHAFVNCVDCLASHVIVADLQKWDRATAIEEWNKRAALEAGRSGEADIKWTPELDRAAGQMPREQRFPDWAIAQIVRRMGNHASTGEAIMQKAALLNAAVPQQPPPVGVTDALDRLCNDYANERFPDAGEEVGRLMADVIEARNAMLRLSHQQPAPSVSCLCGESTCVEPWEPGCGLGNSEEHARPVSEPAASGEGLLELLRSIRPVLGTPGTRDEDVIAQQQRIDEAIRRLTATGPGDVSLDSLAQQMADRFPLAAIVRALDKAAPGIRGAFAAPRVQP